jgi:hypothetical protein
MLKAITRGAMQVAAFILMLPFWIIFMLLMILVYPIYAVMALWDRLELWAYYDGDEAKRDKDRWRYS